MNLSGTMHALREELYPKTFGPKSAMVVLPDDEFDQLRQRLFEDTSHKWFVLRPRRKRLDPNWRWFMIAGIRIVAANYAAAAIIEEPTCPRRMR